MVKPVKVTTSACPCARDDRVDRCFDVPVLKTALGALLMLLGAPIEPASHSTAGGKTTTP